MKSDERPVAEVPRWVLICLAGCLCAQLGWKAATPPGSPGADDLPVPPRPEILQVAAFGDPVALARLAVLYLQTFDYHGTNAMPYRKLDYQRLTGWLEAIQRLDINSEYPLFLSARLYAEIPDSKRQRVMLEFIYGQFLLDPNRRWQWAAHASLVAKHRLKDLPLALRYAQGVEKLTTAPQVPLWAKQMGIFILEDMNELDAARIMLGGLLDSGLIQDQGERRFLENRLKELEQRQKSQRP